MRVPESPRTFKIVLVGDSGVGKSTLATNLLPRLRISYDESLKIITYKSILTTTKGLLELTLLESPREPVAPDHRQQVFMQADLALFVCDVGKRRTLASIPKSYKEFKEAVREEKPMLLLANKLDLPKGKRVVREEKLFNFIARHMLPLTYKKVSATKRYGLSDVLLWMGQRLTMDLSFKLISLEWTPPPRHQPSASLPVDKGSRPSQTLRIGGGQHGIGTVGRQDGGVQVTPHSGAPVTNRLKRYVGCLDLSGILALDEEVDANNRIPQGQVRNIF